MSKVVIQGDANGTGVFTIASPNSNTDRTLTLPDETGTVDTLQRAGNVLQVVQSISSTSVTNNTTTWVSTGLSASITPASSSSKIFALVSVPVQFGDNGGNAFVSIRLTRDGTEITQSGTGNNIQYIVQQFNVVSFSYVDSPSSSSAITYQVDFAEKQMANRYGNTTVISSPYAGVAVKGMLQLMEIAG